MRHKIVSLEDLEHIIFPSFILNPGPDVQLTFQVSIEYT